MNKKIFQEITKKNSTTFYYASLFFPPKVRGDVFILYSFLRTADDIVDEKNDKKLFLQFKNEVYQSIDKKNKSKNIIIKAFTEIYEKYRFSKDYLDSFFRALEMDFKKPLVIKNKKELEDYTYGVAGVVGLMMAKITGLSKSFFNVAKEFGQLMQIVNILRDIKEDYEKSRIYLPQEDLKKFSLTSIVDVKNNQKTNFINLIRFEINQILKRMAKLSKYINKIPQPYRRPIKISQEVYLTLARKIYQNPLRILKERVYLPKYQMLFVILKNII